MPLSRNSFENAKKSAQKRLGGWIEDCKSDKNSGINRLRADYRDQFKTFDWKNDSPLSSPPAPRTSETDILSTIQFQDDGKNNDPLPSIQTERLRDSNSSNRSSRLETLEPTVSEQELAQGIFVETKQFTQSQSPIRQFLGTGDLKFKEVKALNVPEKSKRRPDADQTGKETLSHYLAGILPPVNLHSHPSACRRSANQGVQLVKPPAKLAPISSVPGQDSLPGKQIQQFMKTIRRRRRRKMILEDWEGEYENGPQISVMLHDSDMRQTAVDGHPDFLGVHVGHGPHQSTSRQMLISRVRSRLMAASMCRVAVSSSNVHALHAPTLSTSFKHEEILRRFRRLVKLLIHVRVLLNCSRLRIENQEKFKTFKAVEEDGSVLTFDPSIYKTAMTQCGSMSLRAKHVLSKAPKQRDEHDGQIMLEVMMRLPFFAKYPNKVKLECARLMWYDNFQKGRVIMKQGDPGTRMYLIIAGEVVLTRTVIKEDGTEDCYKHRILNAGATFGELALIRDLKRDCSVVCTVPSEFLSLSKVEFNTVMRLNWDIECNKRLDFLRNCKHFRDWTEAQIQTCADQSESKRYANNAVILGDKNATDEPDVVFFIRRGSCELVKKIHAVRHKSPYKRPSLLLPHAARARSKFLDKPYGRKLRTEREETHYLTITTLNAGDYFGVGEDLRETFVISRGKTDCVLLNALQYSVLGKREELRNLKKVREDLIPPTRDLFERFQLNRKWYSYRKNLVENVIRGRLVSTRAKSEDVPRSIREQSTIKADLL